MKKHICTFDGCSNLITEDRYVVPSKCDKHLATSCINKLFRADQPSDFSKICSDTGCAHDPMEDTNCKFVVTGKYHRLRLDEEEKWAEHHRGHYFCVVPGCEFLRGHGNRKRCNFHHILQEDLEPKMEQLSQWVNTNNDYGRPKKAHHHFAMLNMLNTIDSLKSCLEEYVESLGALSVAIEIKNRPKAKKRKRPIADGDEKPNALYRFFDAENELLYVGITCNPSARIKAHKSDKEWWADVASMTMEHFDTREELEEAERNAIRIERPRFNIIHNNLAAMN